MSFNSYIAARSSSVATGRGIAVGPVNDRYEQEADRMANAVMRAPDGARNTVGPIQRIVQRSTAGAPASVSRGTGQQTAFGHVESVVAHPGESLDAGTRAFFEPRFAHDFSRVRIHHDEAAAGSARALGAHAYTLGEHIVFDRGRYAPASPEGGRLLAHELTHVVQQGGVLRRASISPLEQSAMPDERQDDDGKVRLQRTPAIVGLDESGPKADLTGSHEKRQLEQIAECQQKKGPDPDECSPPRPLTWNDYTGSAVARSPYAAWTVTTTTKVDVPTQQCAESVLGHRTAATRIYQGLFKPSESWVKPSVRDPVNDVAKDRASAVQECQRFFANETQHNRAGGQFRRRLDAVGRQLCPAGDAAPLVANSAADCTTLGRSITNAAIAESARILKHEQYHFKLTCALAKKANRQIALGASFAAIDAVIGNKLNRAQHEGYDVTSRHGCNADVQSAWEREIDAGLPSITLP